MNKILLIRNLMLIKRNYLKYLIILMITPMILYLFNILPYSDQSTKIWSSIGLWIASCIISSYIYIYQNISSYGMKKRIFLMNSSVSTLSIIRSNIVICLILAFFQLLISYMLTYSLNNVSISLINFMLLVVNILPIILFFISIALLIALFDSLNMGLFICSLIALSIIQFFYLYPAIKELGYDHIPPIGVLLNCGALFNNQSIQIAPLILMYILSLSFIFTSLMISNNIIRSRNEE